ncbi:SPFH domain-containing protein [Halomonas elongata]|uniref:SPFH domain-containing protein n=1 Tax=Halomonas elongata (strain ATCC 33173 / DSM 2581 / NBRC 15536 / NCIMB 2198 / 1H9) TaxID=768066 RepID=E1V6H6_HALED|nr:SPFH domain-containing protein [Halomonas elongata]MBW5800915.1 SPFH/Band 7/PHB domain protein [Halomonas elongata]MDL4863433.1 SPFH domain-containing protein [Halomonas elongata]RAW07602.1 SPFH/Band 7/PHB domain protein [Halomonas elongata]WBF18540.1 SPFH/Band 7/PHB domain protein [Halomonas elongata]WPU47394.1 SPFH domain-containing protein [Halomonas elongata DSM 2581]
MDLPVSPGLILSLIIVVIGILIIVKGLVVVRQSEVMVIERLGSFNRLLESGINIIIPFIEQPRAITMIRYRKMGDDYHAITSDETRIDRRETVMDFPGQPVVTTDNVTVTINGALYYQVIDPKRAVYEVENMSQAVEVLAKTTLRSVVGKMELDKLFESRSEVNNEIQAAMEEPASKWGVKISRVEVQDIAMPEEVESAMRLQMAAERKRRATVTEAEGEKSAAIAMAQGQRESAILNAEGDKESAILRAQGEQESIKLVLNALGDSEDNKQTVVGYLLGQSYIKGLPNMAKEGERVFVPYESSALLGSMGMFRELAGSPEDAVSTHLQSRGNREGLRSGMVGGASSGS